MEALRDVRNFVEERFDVVLGGGVPERRLADPRRGLDQRLGMTGNDAVGGDRAGIDDPAHAGLERGAKDVLAAFDVDLAKKRYRELLERRK